MSSLIAPSLLIDESRLAPRAISRINWRMGLLAATCLLSALAGRLIYIIRPFDSDGSMFIYMGRLISEGGRFCHELVDNKLPSVGLMTSVPWRVFGANWASYVLLGGAMSFIGCLLLSRIAERNFGAHAKLPALLFAVVYLNFNFAVFGGFQLETIQTFFAILAASAAMEWLGEADCRDAFAVGLAAGCAAMCKPTGLAPLAALVLIAPFARRSLRENIFGAIALLLGLALPLGVVLIYLVRTDTLRDMPALFEQISRYAANSAWEASDWTKPATILILGGFPILVRGWIFRREKDRLDISINRIAMMFALAWLVIEAIGIVMQRRMYAYHFLPLAAPLTLVFAMLPRKIRVAPLAAALVPMALFSMYGAYLVYTICYTGDSVHPDSAYIAAYTEPGDAVWKDDAARLWLEADRRPASRLPMTFLFANYDSAPTEYVAQLLADFDRTRPVCIILPTQRQKWVKHQADHIAELARFPIRRANFERAWNEIFAYVDSKYSLETRIDQQEIYRIRK